MRAAAPYLQGFIDAELQRFSILKKNHADEQYLARKNIRDLPERIEQLTQRLEALTADQAGDDDGSIPGVRVSRSPPHFSTTTCPVLMSCRRSGSGTCIHPQQRPNTA